MSEVDAILNGVAAVFPRTSAFIEAARKFAPLAGKAIPVVIAAAREGPEAYAAAKAAAPDLFEVAASFAGAAKAALGSTEPADDHEVATFSAHIVGAPAPGWTRESTQRWWELASNDR